MKEIHVKQITESVKKMFIDANYFLGDDVKGCIKVCASCEKNELAKQIFDIIGKNIDIAEKGVFPLCQDTGMACIFMEIGQDVHFTGGNLYEAVNEGVRQGCLEGYLRQSIVRDPFDRVNTGDSTPADINVEIVSGDRVKILVAPKGFGSENMSQIKMLSPAEGVNGAEDFIVDVVRQAGGNPCPPVVVGVGIGGNFSKAALMAKKALFRPIGVHNSQRFYEDMEKRLLDKINLLGIGPQGLGGKTTALAVNIISEPTHIAGMPVAVNINCHVSRHKEAIL
ncbi:MAG: fumarate hydratase [Eubacteriales bacterium]|nr:fumarate hydratase [Eubacteriales bacterium]